jgi:acetyl esterase
LAPGAPWPAGAEDVGAAVKWVRENIVAYGGDPDQVYVIGHSAGAAHVAQFALHKDLQPAGGHGAAGVVLMSGTYGINPDRIAPSQIAYYGDDKSQYTARQLIGNTAWGDFKVFITFAEFDPAMFPISGLQLAAELSRTNQRLPRVKQLLGHNHPSSTQAIGTGDPTVAPEILDFILNPSDAVG